MYRSLLFVFVAVCTGLGVFIWASDRITLEGERTIYTVGCEQGVWAGLRCTGRLTPGDRYRFRASKSRNEIVYWIAGSRKPSGKYSECDVTDRDRWSCKPYAGEPPTIAHELSEGRPVQHAPGLDMPFHAVSKWKWWALDVGFPGFTKADFSSDPNAPGTIPPHAGRR